MREVLFKSKIINKDKWSEEGSYVYLNGKDYIVPWYASAWYGIEINPSTLCQYSCFKDKNGTKIFECDKVKVCLDPEIKTGVVRFNEEIACFCIYFEDSFVTFLDVAIAQKKVHEKVWVEVIGNIHDKED